MFFKIYVLLVISLSHSALADPPSVWETINSEVRQFQFEISGFRASVDETTPTDPILLEMKNNELKDRRQDLKEAETRNSPLISVKKMLVEDLEREIKELSRPNGDFSKDHETVKKMNALLGKEPSLPRMISVLGFYEFLIEWMSFQEKSAALKRKEANILGYKESVTEGSDDLATSERVLEILSSANLIVRQNPGLMPALKAFSKGILNQEIIQVLLDLHSTSRDYRSLSYEIRNFIESKGTISIPTLKNDSLINLAPNTSFMNSPSCKNLLG